MALKVLEFKVRFGMSQAYGCINGNHVPIKLLMKKDRTILITGSSIPST